MRLEYESEKKVKEEILRIIAKYLDLEKYKVFVFGSRVTGKGDEHSDIDIGIEGSEKVPFQTILNIEDEIEEMSYLYKIELVDMKRVSPEFYNVAKKHVEVLNP